MNITLNVRNRVPLGYLLGKGPVMMSKLNRRTTETSGYYALRPTDAFLSTLPNWDQHNRKVLKGDVIGRTDENTSITKNCIGRVNQTSCHDFKESTSQLEQRARHINYWKAELERAISDIDTEINKLERLRQQLKNSMDILNIPEHITQECLDMRTNRLESDLIYDYPQETLFSESVLIENIKLIQRDLLRDIEGQQRMNVAAKNVLERDWSDKKLAFKYESNNSELQTTSEQVKDSAGATKLAEGQSNVESWEYNTVNILEQFKSAIEKSKALRAKVETSIMNAARDLRTQDIEVNKRLSERIARTERVKTDLEEQLKIVLAKIVETENILVTLNEEILKVSQRIQVAQTRLNTKQYRPNVENCREGSLYALIEEVRDLNNSMTLLENRSRETYKLRGELIQERSLLENEIIVKKKSIYVDNERCLSVRSFYQSAEKLSGF